MSDPADGESFDIAPGLADEVLRALGVDDPPEATLDGLARLYAAFAAVPFDNTPKLLAVREGSLIPGADPTATFEAWLGDGRGGSCWALAGGLAALARGCGMDAWCSLERRPAANVDLHGATVVAVEGGLWLCDPMWRSGRPLRLSDGGDRDDHTPFVPRVVPEQHRWRHQVRASWGEIDYAVISTALDRADVDAVVEVTRTHSNINDSVWVRRSDPERSVSVRVALGSDVGSVMSYTGEPPTTEELPAGEALARFGLAPSRVEDLRSTGLIS